MAKKFKIEEYEPIDYRNWVLGDDARKGINIKRLGVLLPEELKLWNALEPYQDSRNDAGHAEMATYLAIKLWPYYPKAVREVSISATEGHDIGFYGEDPDAWQRAVEVAQKAGNLASLNSDAKRMPHQIKGARMFLDISKKAGYPSERYRNESSDIIRDHDTRHNPTTPSGRVMWDADYGWRVTLPCNQIYVFNKGIFNPLEVLKLAEETCLETKAPHNLEGVAKKVARLEIANTIYYKYNIQQDSLVPEEFQGHGEQALKPNYSKELEIVKRFYASSA